MAQGKLSIEHVVLSNDSESLLLKISHLYAEISAEDIIALLKTPLYLLSNSTLMVSIKQLMLLQYC
ncbi:hypothetical protein [Psychromonas sp. GE-S-Ul-11]|uniref:hypothetical protein n=1 Tax=Psychromonas sp. GE-S-Ul-11 TaxID=3241170 RepID=UPI003AAEC77E